MHSGKLIAKVSAVALLTSTIATSNAAPQPDMKANAVDTTPNHMTTDGVIQNSYLNRLPQDRARVYELARVQAFNRAPMIRQDAKATREAEEVEWVIMMSTDVFKRLSYADAELIRFASSDDETRSRMFAVTEDILLKFASIIPASEAPGSFVPQMKGILDRMRPREHRDGNEATFSPNDAFEVIVLLDATVEQAFPDGNLAQLDRKPPSTRSFVSFQNKLESFAAERRLGMVDEKSLQNCFMIISLNAADAFTTTRQHWSASLHSAIFAPDFDERIAFIRWLAESHQKEGRPSDEAVADHIKTLEPKVWQVQEELRIAKATAHSG